MRNHIVRSILMFVTLVVISVTANGCFDNPFGPKLDFYGQGYNPYDVDVVAFIDGVQISSLEGDPVIRPGHFTVVYYLRGSMKHRFLVYSYPDATILKKDTEEVVNSVSGDAYLKGGVDETPDWAWVFGRRVQP